MWLIADATDVEDVGLTVLRTVQSVRVAKLAIMSVRTRSPGSLLSRSRESFLTTCFVFFDMWMSVLHACNSYLRELEAKVRFYEGAPASNATPLRIRWSELDFLRMTRAADHPLESQPRLKLAFANLDRSGPSNIVGEDDAFEDDMVIPEAFTQLSVGSPGNSSTGMAFTYAVSHGLPSV